MYLYDCAAREFGLRDWRSCGLPIEVREDGWMLLLWNAVRNRKSGVFFTVIHYLLQRFQLLRDFINSHIYSFGWVTLHE